MGRLRLALMRRVGQSSWVSKHMLKTFLERYQSFLPMAALVTATFLWGSSFISTATALKYTDPFMLVMCRFLIGAAIVGVALRGRVNAIPRHTWKAGIITGILLYAGYITNALGLMTINSSTSGFLTALYVPFTPLMIWVVFGKKPNVNAVIGVVIAFVGLMLLANPFTLSFSNNFGEWVTILCAFISATEIIMVGLVATKNEALPLTFAQLITVATLCAITRLFGPLFPAWSFEPTEWTTTLISAIVWLGFIVGFAQMLLTWGQKTVSAGRAAVIFAMESVFAAMIGWMIGERLGWTGWLGGALIVVAILINKTRLLCSQKRKK